jgi:hypothetical protein
MLPEERGDNDERSEEKRAKRAKKETQLAASYQSHTMW